jgi:hypothetical protein
MKSLYSILIVMVAVVVLAAVAVAKPPFWDDQINSPKRFKVLGEFGGEAVFDKETGLVWEQSPDGVNTRTWVAALDHCYTKTVGGRKGWRLPTIEELASLLDPNNPGGNPDLPPGHPFDNVQSAGYWSATTDAGNTANAWGVGFGFGDVGPGGKGNNNFVWCVRGGQGIDGVQ